MKKEFSKKMLITCLIICILTIVAYYALCWISIRSDGILMPDASIATVAMSGGICALLGYFAYSFGQKNSRNKYRVDVNGLPLSKEEAFFDLNAVVQKDMAKEQTTDSTDSVG